MFHAHSPSFPSLHLRHSSFSNPFRRFTYVTVHSPTIQLLHLRHSSFSNPSFAFPMPQALHLRHLASRPCSEVRNSLKTLKLNNEFLVNSVNYTIMNFSLSFCLVTKLTDYSCFLKSMNNGLKTFMHRTIQLLYSNHEKVPGE